MHFDQEQLIEAIRIHGDADVFHCHNEPSWFVNLIKGVHPNIPVVLDVHDSMLIRYSEDTDDENAVRISVSERDNFQLADGLVFVSEPMADICRGTYGLEQPYTVLPSYLPKYFYRIDAFKWYGGVVYEGRVDITEEVEDYKKFFAYCDYRDLAKKFTDMGIMFAIYAPNRDKDKMNKAYHGTAMFHDAQQPLDLTRTLGSYNYGILGNITQHEAWKYAMPNKLFDYLGAGIPIIALNAPLAGKFVEENGYGMNITDPDQIPELWPRHREFRKNIAETRWDWAMENHIHKVLKLYEELIC